MPDYPADRIFAPVKSVKEIADNGHTPFYLYNEDGIRNSIFSIQNAFSWVPQHQNYFALRKNTNPYLLKILSEAGSGVSVVSRTELEYAVKCGFTGDMLLYEPSVRDTRAEEIAANHDTVWLFNSAATIPDAIPRKLFLRYNPCDLMFPSQTKQTVTRSKNGFNRSQIIDMILKLQEKGAEQIGLALEVSSYSIQSGFWSRKASILFSLAEEISHKTGTQIWGFYIGEGPGLPYHPRFTAPDLKSEAEAVHTAYDRTFDGFRPAVYTGVCSRVMEAHGLLITKVLEQRYIYKTFLLVDAGVCQYSRSVLKQAYRHVSVLGKNQTEDRKLYSVVGSLPESFDRLVSKGRLLPKVEPGDYCVVHDVGCGGRSMPLLYGFRPIAAEFLYQSDGTIRQIAPGRTEQEVLNFLTAW